MAHYELTIIVTPQTCEVKVDGRAPHYRNHQTGVNSWRTRLGVHDVVLRHNGVELRMEVDNSESDELTVHMAPNPGFDAAANPGAEINSKKLQYEATLRNARGRESKNLITYNNILAARGLKKGTYYVRDRVRIFKPRTPNPNATPKPKLKVTG